MGTDKLHSRRKARNLKAYNRKLAKLAPYDRVLIICEGEKTEPYYFNGLREEYKLDTANIVITGNCGSDPLRILEFAKQQYKISKDEGNAFNRVYCVFDKDSHHNYNSAIRQISGLIPQNTFFAVNSVPCFEYWLLLHFLYTTKAFSSSGNRSVADNVIKELKTHFPNYSKGQKNIFNQLKPNLANAIHRAKKANEEAKNNNTDNPSTKIVELVEYLIDLKNNNRIS